MQPLKLKIGFIGAGNMATAIFQGFVNAKKAQYKDIFVSDKNIDALTKLSNTGINTFTKNADVVENADIVFIAVKPQFCFEVLDELKLTLDKNVLSTKIFVSIVTGVSISKMQAWLGGKYKIIRTMPNTPALVGEGMTVLSYCAPVTKSEFDIVLDLFSSIGMAKEIDEEKMIEVISVMGSSPAYIYYFADIMAKKAVAYGFNESDAVKMVAQSILGAAKMIINADADVSINQLKTNVCSKGGTTLAALGKIEDGRLKSALEDGMDACTKRALELSEGK